MRSNRKESSRFRSCRQSGSCSFVLISPDGSDTLLTQRGTLSLLISLPTMLVGLGRHRARGAFRDRDDLRRLVTPMSVGAIAGGIAGGLLVPHVPAALVKLLLGLADRLGDSRLR